MELRVLSAADVRACVDMPTAIDIVAEAFRELSAGRAQSPVRLSLNAPGGVALFMPAYLQGPGAMGAKVVSVFRGNAERGLPAIHGLVLVLDGETGVPRSVMDGTYLTALRTGASSGVATRLLARKDARVLAMFGSGGQSRTQIEAVRAVRDIREVRIVSADAGSARALAASLEGVEARVMEDPAEAVRGADVVCTATTSRTPVFPAEAVGPGTHVNGIGSYTPEMQEVAPELVARARVVVDARAAALEEAGDLIVPLREGRFGEDHIAAELGEIVAGEAPGRLDDDEVTFFKSVGNAVQDVAVAARVLAAAEARGLGRTVPL